MLLGPSSSEMPSVQYGEVPIFPMYFASRAERKEWADIDIQLSLTL